MKVITQVRGEEDVTGLKAGEWVLINNRPAMKRNPRNDGVDYLMPNGNGTVTIINLRGYHIDSGGIIPVWYHEKNVTLTSGGLR